MKTETEPLQKCDPSSDEGSSTTSSPQFAYLDGISDWSGSGGLVVAVMVHTGK